MKKLLFFTFIITQVIASQAQLTDGQKTLLEIEKHRIDAITAHDDPFLASLYDEAYRGVSVSGEIVTKSAQLNLYKNQDTHVVFSNEEMVATVYGNTAVITAMQVVKSKTGSLLGQTRYILIYSNLSEKWKIIMGQETEVTRK